ncbi:NRPS [Alternaria ventricosa]|uniref:NRPS n=1 Tax=Alternaria ventricosa TaxID=1187951 RepID=UPI0020C387B8|nr:NRPS [Alternaria ventricosa]KAI4641282.1 NRPS [Alternaria ventricosa]
MQAPFEDDMVTSKKLESRTIVQVTECKELSSSEDSTPSPAYSSDAEEDGASMVIDAARSRLLHESNDLEDPLPLSEQVASGPMLDADSAPATDLQAAFIQSGQSTIHYFETWHLEDLPFIKYAWKTVMALEPIFRTTFEEAGPGAYVMRKGEFQFPWTDVVTFDRKAYEEELTRVEGQAGPTFVFKSVVYKASGSSRHSHGDSEATIMLSIHHALLDGFAMQRLADKVRRVAAGETGAGVKAGKSFLSVARELEMVRREHRAAATEYWNKRVQGHAGAATGPDVRKPMQEAKQPSSQRMRNEVNVDFAHLSGRLQARSRQLGVTVAALFHAAWAVVQAMYADSSRVVFGTIMSGRNTALDGIDTVIGPLLNSLPLHVSVDEDMTTDEMVQGVFRDLVELSCYQWSTCEHGFERDFEAALSVTRGLDSDPTRDGMRPIRPVRYDFESSIPLSLALDEAAMTLRAVYHTDKYAACVVEDMAACFVSALERLTHSIRMQQCLGGVMTVPIQGRLRAWGNCLSGFTTRAAHQSEDLVSVFETTARLHADAVAVEMGSVRVTYAELNWLASRTAQRLKELGVGVGGGGSDQVVCVHADGSLEWIVGLLGALKAEATFCSLDVTLPHQLRSDMFGAARSRVFVIGHEWQRQFVPDGCTHCLVQEPMSRLPATPETATSTATAVTSRTPRPRAPAYLCFTSGSTGKPKGVLCTHQALVAFQSDLQVRLHAAPGVRIAQFMSPAFDGSIHETFSALGHGATLVLRPQASAADPFSVLHHVSSAIMTPSVARSLLPADFSNLETVYLVGEQVPPSVVDAWAPGHKLYNMYGPTEGTGGATITRLHPRRPVTIGRPNLTSRLYILGRDGRLLPPGAVGQIHIAGVQVALGYANMPVETAARFVPDTVCPDLGELMYCTGDDGYWDHNGEVVCLGRRDRQLKLRGFRLDLDDLETRIVKTIPSVRAVALAKSARGDGLVAMVQPASLCRDAVRDAMRHTLPRAAVPLDIACVDEFPLTRAGKVDAQAITVLLSAH